MDLTKPQDNASCAAFALPAELPVMVLSECFLFPGCFLPLFIFEQRYRDMLQHALSTDRMFCIGARASKDSNEILPVSTAGIIHSCVKHDDGTSHLILMGLRRIKFTGWAQEKPFRIATVEPVCSEPAPAALMEELRSLALSLLPPCHEESASAIQALCEQLKRCPDTELVCDVLTYHFINCPELLSASLNQPCVMKRYQLLIDALKAAKE